jgi:hypothetical protein
LIKRIAMYEGWEWEVKKLLDLAIYSNTRPEEVFKFLSAYLERSEK